MLGNYFAECQMEAILTSVNNMYLDATDLIRDRQTDGRIDTHMQLQIKGKKVKNEAQYMYNYSDFIYRT